jgi:hypothetical protein
MEKGGDFTLYNWFKYWHFNGDRGTTSFPVTNPWEKDYRQLRRILAGNSLDPKIGKKVKPVYRYVRKRRWLWDYLSDLCEAKGLR